MKNLILSLAVFGAFAATASIESQQLTSKGFVPRIGAKLIHVDVLSSTAAADIDVKSVSEIWATRNDITSVSTTNTYYQLVYSNGVNQVLTNITDYSQLPLPRGIGVMSYTTNDVVTTKVSTNKVDYISAVITNTLTSVTCSSGRGYANPENTYIVPGDKVIPDGDDGRVILFLEK